MSISSRGSFRTSTQPATQSGDETAHGLAPAVAFGIRQARMRRPLEALVQELIGETVARERLVDSPDELDVLG